MAAADVATVERLGPARGDAPTHSRPDDQSGEIWSRLIEQIEYRLHQIETPISTLLNRKLSAEELADVGERCESLARWTGRLGLSVAAGLVRDAAQRVLDASADVGAAIAAASALEDLRVSLADTGSGLIAARQQTHHVVAYGHPSPELDSLLFVLATRGLGVQVCTDSVVIDVDVVLLPLDVTEVGGAGLLIRDLRQRYPSCPLIPVLDPGVVLKADALAGVDVVTTNADPTASAELIIESVVRSELPRVLLLAGTLLDELPPVEFQNLEPIRFDHSLNPTGLTSQLEATGARCLVVATDDLSAARAAAEHMRTTPLVRGTPMIAVLPDHLVDQAELGLLRSGFDTVLPLSTSPDRLAAVVVSRLERRRMIEPIEAAAEVGRALPWPTLRLLGERMLVSESRLNRKVCVALVRLDEHTPSAVLDDSIEQLAGEFRREDITGWRSEREAIVLLPGLARSVAVQRFQSIGARLGLEESARIGIAEFPSDGRTLDPLLAVAAAVIEQTTEADGPVVATSDWQTGLAGGADVLIVEPELAMRAVIANVLDDLGLTWAESADGVDALDYLTGADRPPPPKVVLMEFDLEGIDGVRVLRHLRTSGALGRFRVLMLSSRADEIELREAFSIGAVDVVRKPFAPLILGHRLLRVLDR